MPHGSHTCFFVDDCLVFTQASERGGQRLAEILHTYQAGSGQMMNTAKSTIFYSANCDDSMKEEMKQSTGILTEALCEKYLGLPTALGCSTAEAFEPIPAKVRGLVGGWSEKLLSSAAKEVLIKSVAQDIPTYPLSCFLLSSRTRKKITSAVSNFWWGGSADSRAIHWKTRSHSSEVSWRDGLPRYQVV